MVQNTKDPELTVIKLLVLLLGLKKYTNKVDLVFAFFLSVQIMSSSIKNSEVFSENLQKLSHISHQCLPQFVSVISVLFLFWS